MDICGLVLAGGKSSRMEGKNKAFLSYNDKTFLENVISELNGLKKIYISVDEKKKYSNLNYELIEDEYKEIGPMGGLYSAFKNTDEDLFFVTACDMPKLNHEFVQFLMSKMTDADKCLVVRDSDDRLYPLGGIYSRKIVPIIEDMIKNKDYKLVNLIKNAGGRIISLEKSGFTKEVLINVNNPDEYKMLK